MVGPNAAGKSTLVRGARGSARRPPRARCGSAGARSGAGRETPGRACSPSPRPRRRARTRSASASASRSAATRTAARSSRSTRRTTRRWLALSSRPASRRWPSGAWARCRPASASSRRSRAASRRSRGCCCSTSRRPTSTSATSSSCSARSTSVRRCGVAVLAVVHDLARAAQWADRMLLVADGRIAAEGAPGAVLASEAAEPGLRRPHPRPRGPVAAASSLQLRRGAVRLALDSTLSVG